MVVDTCLKILDFYIIIQDLETFINENFQIDREGDFEENKN